MNNIKKTGLYIHIPFCIRKCAYCDFVSYEGVSCSLKEKYIIALKSEMANYKGEQIGTVYFGGGTPTTLDSSQIESLMKEVRHNFIVDDDAEITIECNPKTADIEYFKVLRNCGINRLSIGVQSLIDEELAFLGRVHSKNEAISCIEQAKVTGFENFSVDVMFGLPGQTLENIEETLEGLTNLSPAHISCYSLIIEPGTRFYEAGIKPLEDEKEREMQAFIVDYLKEKGFHRYEISNFAKDGKISVHNTKYWEGVPYIGIGAASSSYFNGERYEKDADLLNYIENPHDKINIQKLTKEDEMSEFMILGLRMMKGVSCSDFYKRFGVSLEDKYDIKKILKLGLLIKKGDILMLSDKGIDVSNAVLCEFV